jgi:signal transduction histidine kinase
MNNKILVIDDDTEILNDYRMILTGDRTEQQRSLKSIAEELGLKPAEQVEEDMEEYDVTVSPCGEEGIKRVELSLKDNEPFAVVFCDMRMPNGMDGLETGKRIREFDHRVEIVFVTGYSDHRCHNIVKEIGSPEKLLYLKKPFDPDEIRQLALKLTKSWQMEQDLKSALLQAKEADKAKSDFLTLVTHEFKTPLTGIIGAVQTLKTATRKKTLHANIKFLDMAERSAFRILGMVDEILAFSRAQSQQTNFNLDRFNLKDFLDSLVEEEIEPLLESKPLALTVDAPGIPIYADREKLRNIIMNLVSNAIKFTRSGSVEIICRQNGNDRVTFKISDTGRGIPAEHVEKIFDQFYQVNREIDEQQGAGLGLAIVKQYVELHGGMINVESTEGAGTTFRFSLPNRLPQAKGTFSTQGSSGGESVVKPDKTT